MLRAVSHNVGCEPEGRWQQADRREWSTTTRLLMFVCVMLMDVGTQAAAATPGVWPAQKAQQQKHPTPLQLANSHLLFMPLPSFPQVFNCDDLLMNFVAANLTRAEARAAGAEAGQAQSTEGPGSDCGPPAVRLVRPQRRLDLSRLSGVGECWPEDGFFELRNNAGRMQVGGDWRCYIPAPTTPNPDAPPWLPDA